MHGEEAGSDDVPFEVGGNTQEEAGILQSDSLGVTKPGINRHGGHVRLHERFYFSQTSAAEFISACGPFQKIELYHVLTY